MKKIIRLNIQDNVITALEKIEKGDIIKLEDEIIALNNILFEHKMAIQDIKKGEIVRKYGVPIGVAYKDIKKGEHVHLHNLKTIQDDNISNLDETEWKNRNA